MKKLENEKYDMEKEVEYKDYKVWVNLKSTSPLQMQMHIFPFNVYIVK